MPESPRTRNGLAGRRAGNRLASAIVVGAGVSGCACAAVLASQGIQVTAINGVLDAVGLPGYGPDLTAGTDGWDEISQTMMALPSVLREVWLSAASAPKNGPAFLAVDRRAVSIETKRALERIPGLEFRQGLVTNIRLVAADARSECDSLAGPGPGNAPGHRWEHPLGRGSGRDRERVAVETFFGEVFEADAVIVAVGLALGGRVWVGADPMPGGRYGEMPADALQEALAELGATFRRIELEVGMRLRGYSTMPGNSDEHAQARRSAIANMVAQGVLEDGAATWPLRHVELDSAVDVLVRALGPNVVSDRSSVDLNDHTAAAGDSGGRQRSSGDYGGDCDGGDSSCSFEGDLGHSWPDDYPPAAHWTGSLRATEALLEENHEGTAVPLLLPDGIATAEYYSRAAGAPIRNLDDQSAAAEAAVTIGKPGATSDGVSWFTGESEPACRLPQRVGGLEVTSLDSTGRLAIDLPGKPSIWVTGRAAGSTSYLESLRSGARVAEHVARFLQPHSRARKPVSPAARPHDDPGAGLIDARPLAESESRPEDIVRGSDTGGSSWDIR